MPWNWNDAWKFLLQLSSAVGILYGLFRLYGEKWLDKHFAEQLEKVKLTNQQELEHTKHAIQSMFSRIVKIHEKEYEVLPKAWYMLHVAFGSAYIAVGAKLVFRPDFKKMSEAKFESFLQISRLLPNQQDELRSSKDRNATYREAISAVEFDDAMENHRAFNNYLIEHRIFMTVELAAKFEEVSHAISSGLNEYTIGRDCSDYKLESTGVERIVKCEKLLPEVQKLIQERLCYEQA